MSAPGWIEPVQADCNQFQLNLSCLVDGELEPAGASLAIAHIELCADCRQFFDDVRLQVRAHMDLAQPERLLARLRTQLGVELGEGVLASELASKLAAIFYKLGKAYTLLAIDPDFRTQVFEPAVSVAQTQTRGRGFVDAVRDSGRGARGSVDWTHAHNMLNGQLSRIENPLEKGKRLLQEALAVDPEHEETRLYLAYVAAHEGKRLRAAREFRQIFRTSISEANRGHAAMQLAVLHEGEGEYRKAVACLRWVISRGIAEYDERFLVARFTLALCFAHLRQPDRSLAQLRLLLDEQPQHVERVADMFRRSPQLRAAIDAQRGFAQSLLATCPELFRPAAAEDADDAASRDVADDE
jgi:tetratricopeptide (TPR) repeat protein